MYRIVVRYVRGTHPPQSLRTLTNLGVFNSDGLSDKGRFEVKKATWKIFYFRPKADFDVGLLEYIEVSVECVEKVQDSIS